MRSIVVVGICLFFSVACSNGSKDAKTKTVDDSLPNQGHIPNPPDIGSSPAAGDSTAKIGDSLSDKPTPGLGSDPTRNDASKKPDKQK